MLSQEILDLYKKSRLMTYRAMFGRIREKTGSLSATEAYAVDVIYLLGSPTITQLAETLGISAERHLQGQQPCGKRVRLQNDLGGR